MTMLLSTLSALDKLTDRHILCVAENSLIITNKKLEKVCDIEQGAFDELLNNGLVYDTLEVVTIDDKQYQIYKVSKDGKRVFDEHMFNVKDF